MRFYPHKRTYLLIFLLLVSVLCSGCTAEVPSNTSEEPKEPTTSASSSFSNEDFESGEEGEDLLQIIADCLDKAADVEQICMGIEVESMATDPIPGYVPDGYRLVTDPRLVDQDGTANYYTPFYFAFGQELGDELAKPLLENGSYLIMAKQLYIREDFVGEWPSAPIWSLNNSMGIEEMTKDQITITLPAQFPDGVVESRRLTLEREEPPHAPDKASEAYITWILTKSYFGQ